MQNAIETIRQHRTYRHFKAGLSLPEADVQTIIRQSKPLSKIWRNTSKP